MQRQRKTGRARRLVRQGPARSGGTRGGGRRTARSGSAREAAVVSFDIVGHGRYGRDHQLERIAGINRVVATSIAAQRPGSVLWTSGGDGGHVLFLGDGWQAQVLLLVRGLLRRGERAGVGLRIAAHRGPVDVIEGADGRPQPVGDAINTAARVLGVGSEAGIVVSSRFRTAFGAAAGVEFHEERLVRLEHDFQLELCLMSVGRRSRWSERRGVDHRMLLDAVEAGMGLEAIYLAKRLLQLNSRDPEVTSALAGLEPIHFRYRTASGKERLNPILGHLDPASLRQLIEYGELIERGCGEVICRRGEVGHSMFVVLRGQVGVYSTVDGGRMDVTPSRVTLAEGEIVEELAFALSRRRTADVISLAETALLSFDHQHVSRLLDGGGAPIGGLVRGFMNGRALEHLSQAVPYLIGHELAALPDRLRRQWRGHLDVLQLGSHIVERPPHRPFRLADLRSHDPRRTAGGIYILASGRLSTRSADAGARTRRLGGDGYTLLYVDLPHRLVAPDHEYMVDEGPAKIVFIGLDAINELPSDVCSRMVRELKRSLPSLYHYDAFISYNFADLAAAERWERGLERAGLTVFRDTPARPGLHYPTRDGQALLDSLVQLVLVSASAMKDPHENWLLKEVQFREEHFDQQPHIVPVRLAGGDPRAMRVLYSSIVADGREADALEEVAQLIRAIRNGSDEPPYGAARHESALG